MSQWGSRRRGGGRLARYSPFQSRTPCIGFGFDPGYSAAAPRFRSRGGGYGYHSDVAAPFQARQQTMGGGGVGSGGWCDGSGQSSSFADDISLGGASKQGDWMCAEKDRERPRKVCKEERQLHSLTQAIEQAKFERDAYSSMYDQSYQEYMDKRIRNLELRVQKLKNNVEYRDAVKSGEVVVPTTEGLEECGRARRPWIDDELRLALLEIKNAEQTAEEVRQFGMQVSTLGLSVNMARCQWHAMDVRKKWVYQFRTAARRLIGEKVPQLDTRQTMSLIDRIADDYSHRISKHIRSSDNAKRHNQIEAQLMKAMEKETFLQLAHDIGVPDLLEM